MLAGGGSSATALARDQVVGRRGRELVRRHGGESRWRRGRRAHRRGQDVRPAREQHREVPPRSSASVDRAADVGGPASHGRNVRGGVRAGSRRGRPGPRGARRPPGGRSASPQECGVGRQVREEPLGERVVVGVVRPDAGDPALELGTEPLDDLLDGAGLVPGAVGARDEPEGLHAIGMPRGSRSAYAVPTDMPSAANVDAQGVGDRDGVVGDEDCVEACRSGGRSRAGSRRPAARRASAQRHPSSPRGGCPGSRGRRGPPDPATPLSQSCAVRPSGSVMTSRTGRAWALAMDLDAYVAAHGSEWRRLEDLTRKRRASAARRPTTLVDRYQQVATHLSVVHGGPRPDPGRPPLLAALPRPQRARARTGTWRGVRLFFVERFPRRAVPVALVVARNARGQRGGDGGDDAVAAPSTRTSSRFVVAAGDQTSWSTRPEDYWQRVRRELPRRRSGSTTPG